MSREEFEEALSELHLKNREVDKLEDFPLQSEDVTRELIDTIRAYVDQLITPNECKKRAFQAAHEIASMIAGNPRPDMLAAMGALERWYTENYGEKDD